MPFIVREIRFFWRSTERIFTFTFSPTFNTSLRGRYTREHIEDENYSTPFMVKLKTAIDDLTCKKKEIENQIDALDSQIKQ